jgi:hypothetical protein
MGFARVYRESYIHQCSFKVTGKKKSYFFGFAFIFFFLAIAIMSDDQTLLHPWFTYCLHLSLKCRQLPFMNISR